MNTRVWRLICIIAATACCTAAASGVPYEIVDLGVIVEGWQEAQGINDNGDIIGSVYGQPSFWQNGMHTIDSNGMAFSLNNHGAVTVMSYTDSPNQTEAFVWQNGVRQNIGALPGCDFSYPYAINDAGHVVGFSQSASDSNHGDGFIWISGQMTYLGSIYGAYSIALAINDHDQVVGYSGGWPFLWQNGIMQNIDDFPNSLGGGGQDINNNGDIAGYVHTPAGGQRPYLWLDGIGHDLGVLPGFTNGTATSINDSGVVTGFLWNETGNRRAFVWQNGSMQELGGLGGSFSVATSINASGQIVGHASVADGYQRAVLWQPVVPEPSGMMILFTSIGGIAFSIKRQKRRSSS